MGNISLLREINRQLQTARPDLKLILKLEDGTMSIYLKKGSEESLFTNCIDNDDQLQTELYDALTSLLTKQFIVSYVGLSDSEQEADGFCETFACATKTIAEEKALALYNEEVEMHEDSKQSIVDDKYIVEWAGGSEKVIIRIHEKYMEWA